MTNLKKTMAVMILLAQVISSASFAADYVINLSGAHGDLDVQYLADSRDGVIVDVSGTYRTSEYPEVEKFIPVTRLELNHQSRLVVLSNGEFGGDNNDAIKIRRPSKAARYINMNGRTGVSENPGSVVLFSL